MMEKRRHILVEYHSTIDTKEPKLFWSAISKELLRCIGEINYHKANPKFEDFVDNTHFIIKTTLSGVSPVVASLALIKKIDSHDVTFFTLKTSGTVKGLLGKRHNIHTSKSSLYDPDE